MGRRTRGQRFTAGRAAARTLGAAMLGAACVSASCAPSKGALIVSVSTDMQTPKDIDVLSVYIATEGVPKFDYLGRVLPDGTVMLPSTLAVVEPDDPSAQVRIRITAFQTQPSGNARARIVRDVLTTVPHGRTVLLRMPLNYLDDGSATGTLPASFVPDPAQGHPEGSTTYDPATPVPTDPGYLQTTCDFTQGQTSVAGVCASATVASSGLPDYDNAEVFGEGGTAQSPTCFAVDPCFAKAAPVTPAMIVTSPDGSCSFPISAGENGQDWNCALATVDGTGECSGGTCLVPLESDPGEGFAIQAGHAVVMVPGVCKRLASGATLYVDRSSCATKVESSPVCQPATKALGVGQDGGRGAGFDATVGADGSGSAPDASTAATDGGSCVSIGHACGSNADCCSLLCTAGVCRASSWCGQPGETCTQGSACCTLACNVPSGQPSGTCASTPPGGPTNCASIEGIVCVAPGDPDAGDAAPPCGGSCCSGACTPYPPTGVFVCQQPSGCHPVGDTCTSSSQCCGAGDAGPAGVQCVINAGATVGSCRLPSGCKPNGDICQLQTTSCASSCDCCSGNCETQDTCRQDNQGVPRCTNAACLDAGSACASSADCCGAAPCVPNVLGGAANFCFGGSCVPAGDPCTTSADCCASLTCPSGTCQ